MIGDGTHDVGEPWVEVLSHPADGARNVRGTWSSGWLHRKVGATTVNIFGVARRQEARLVLEGHRVRDVVEPLPVSLERTSGRQANDDAAHDTVGVLVAQEAPLGTANVHAGLQWRTQTLGVRAVRLLTRDLCRKSGVRAAAII